MKEIQLLLFNILLFINIQYLIKRINLWQSIRLRKYTTWIFNNILLMIEGKFERKKADC